MLESKKEITKKTGDRIRSLRNERRMTQEDLALTAGINPAYIGHIERGLKCPNVDTLNKICTALDISLSIFFNFPTEEPKPKTMTIDKIIDTINNFSDEDAERVSVIISEILKISKKQP